MSKSGSEFITLSGEGVEVTVRISEITALIRIPSLAPNSARTRVCWVADSATVACPLEQHEQAVAALHANRDAVTQQRDRIETKD